MKANNAFLTCLLLFVTAKLATSKPAKKELDDGAPDPEALNLTNVVVMYRHGDRTPIDTYPNDPYKDPKLWPAGFGQLTPRGKMMHYRLGQYLRQRYSNFLPEKYSEQDIYVRSTDIDRTLMSAYSNLAGLYPPKGNQIWNPDIAWQPIPVHTLPENEDNLLSSHSDCPRQNYLVDHLNDLPEIKAINDKYDWVYKYLSEKTGANITGMQHVDYIFDTLYIDEVYNLTLPDWTSKVYPEPMNYLRDTSFKLTTWTDEMKRLRAGPLIRAILEYFQVTANASDIRPKFMMYSGHDTSIASFLNGLGMFDPPIAPPYASMVIVELFFREMDEQHFVKFSYRNETDRDPYVLTLPSCDEFCPLEKFAKLTESLRPKNWTVECRFGSSEADPTIAVITEFSIAVASFLFLVLVVSVVMSFCVRRDRNNSAAHNKYQTINQDYR